MTHSRKHLLENALKTFNVDISQELRNTILDISPSNSLSVTQSSSKDAEDIDVADDPHNALLYKFDLSGPDGPLTGTSIAVKDNIFVSGVPISCGSDTFELTASKSALVVDRLVESGGTIVGTTNMDEFAYYTTGETSAYGPTKNPTVAGSVPGGSSSGSGAAVAGDLVDLALGSDTGGSVRIPASFCGVVGFKPTYGTVPRDGFVSLSPSLDHIGTLAQSVEAAAQALDIIAGSSPTDPSTWFSREFDFSQGIRNTSDTISIGMIDEAFEVSDEKVCRQVSEVCSKLESVGHSVTTTSLEDYRDATTANAAITGMEFTTLLESNGLVYGNGVGVSEELRKAIIEAKQKGNFGQVVTRRLLSNYILKRETDGRSYLAAQDARSEFIEDVADLFKEYDVLVTPTTPMTAPEFGEITDDQDVIRTLLNTAPFNVSGNPALSIPCGTIEGKPVGIQVIGDWYSESTIAQLGQIIEDL